jgi:hypothetical protein
MMKTKKMILLGLAVMFVMLLSYLYLNSNHPYWGDKAGRSGSDLRVVGHAMIKISREKEMTPEDWERVIDANEFSIILGPMFEDPKTAQVDSGGQPLVIEKRKTDNQIAIIVSSSFLAPRRYFWQKEKPVAIEVTLFRDAGKFAEIKYLWHDD